jgi:hypothetical protein
VRKGKRVKYRLPLSNRIDPRLFDSLYSLTMIGDWGAAIDYAIAPLRPGRTP